MSHLGGEGSAVSGRKHLDELAEAVPATGHKALSLPLNSTAPEAERIPDFPCLVTVSHLPAKCVLVVFPEPDSS